jgi:hypothetical protein
MQYTLTTREPLDLAAIERAATALVDPAALIDLDKGGRTLRLATCATHEEVVAALNSAGIGQAAYDLMQLPSECCGGCGG